MKIRTRIATALTAILASVFVASPALASEPGETFDPAAQFSAAGQPVDVVAILIVGVVLLAVVLILSTVVSNLFEPKDR